MIYDFNQSVVERQNDVVSPTPGRHPIAINRLSEVSTPPIASISPQKFGFTDILTGKQLWSSPSDEHDFTEPAFRPLEESLKMFFSGVRVPYKDGYRLLRVKIAAPQRPVAIWRDDLMNGRAVLPVGAIARIGFDYDRTRYAPPYHPMAYRYDNRSASSVSLVYKPTPVIVNYDYSVMCENKTDSDHILTNIMRKFQSGVAECIVNSSYMQWVARMNFSGYSNQTEPKIEDGAKAFIVTVYKMAVEAWLPLPERSVPTALAIRRSVNDYSGNVLYQQDAWG